MDATAMALQQPLRCPSSRYSTAPSSSSKELRRASVSIGRRIAGTEILSSRFCNQGHLLYYNSNFGSSSAEKMTVTSGKLENSAKDKPAKKMKKKQLKLLKALSRDLSSLSQIGFGLASEGALLDQVSGDMISEAAEVLLEQLQKIRANEKELKRKMKEEKARLKAAARMQSSVIDCAMSSGSSSSESSDSECGEVVDINNLKHAQATQIGLQQVLEEATSTYPTPIIPTVTSPQPGVSDTSPVPVLPGTPIPEDNITLQLYSPRNVDTNADNLGETSPTGFAAPTCSKKIEVCMGGKCKRSGAGALLEEFQRVVGIEGAVSGCKCMGKCRDGPNVKVLNGFDADNTVRPSANSLCIGVGLEDVNMIVANILGANHNQLGFAAAS